MKIFWAILAALAVLLFSAGYFIYRYIIVRRKQNDTLPDINSLPPAMHKYILGYDAQMQRLQSWGWEEVHITNWQNARLTGYLLMAKQPTAKTALCIHGYRCHGLREYLYIASMYLEELGMNVLIVDDYAHMASAGKRIGFGWNDRRDCIQWANWLKARFGVNCEVLLHGVSMGGLTVLNAGGDKNLPGCVKWIASDCSPTGAMQQFRHMFKNQYHLPAFPLLHIASLFNRLLNHFFFSTDNGVKSASRIKIPALVIHGLEDKYVPYEMAKEIHGAIKAPTDLVLVPGAAHAQCFNIDPAGYKNAVSRLMSGFAPADNNG